MNKKFFILASLIWGSTLGMASALEPIACTMEYAPVCGSDGKTYGNACGAKAAGITSTTPGECGEPIKACIKAGEMTNGAVAPEYQTNCCAGLETISPYDKNINEAVPTGGGMYCYDPDNGKPYCKDGTCDFPEIIGKPRANVVLPSATQDKISTVLDKILASFMTNGKLNEKGITLAKRLVTKLESMVVSHVKMLETSKFATPEAYKAQLEKGALLELIKTLIQKKLTSGATGKIDPNTCKLYFDGCNTCTIMEDGMSACTKKYCETPTQPYCMEAR